MRPTGEGALPWALSAIGLALLVAGLAMLRDTSIGLEWARLPSEFAGQLPLTVPAAGLVSGAAIVNVAAGSVVMRILTGRPYGSAADAVLGGFAGAVLLDVCLVMALGSVEAFRAVWLSLMFPGVIAIAALFPRLVAPFLRQRPRLGLGGDWPWLLAAVIWVVPVVMILAAPVVTWNDVPANHVAPPEHIRVYGSLDPLGTSPSPRYAASRNFIGYIAFQGTLATLTDIPAARSIVAFVPVLGALVAISGARLGGALFGGGAAGWALLTVPLSYVFLRIPDSRATVAAVPLVAFAILLILRSPRHLSLRFSLALGAALGAAMLMHPLIGGFALATVGVLSVAEPGRYARNAVPAAAVGLTLALPQMAVMLDVNPPAIGGFLTFPLAFAVGWAAGPLAATLASGRVPPAAAAAAVAILLLAALPMIGGSLAAVGSVGSRFPVLAGAALVSLPLLRRHRRPLMIVGAAMATWLIGAGLVNLAPLGDPLGDALRYEVPKTFEYWTTFWWALVAAAGLTELQRRASHAWYVVPILGAFLAAAILPIRAGTVHVSDFLEHRISESLSVSAMYAEKGYWQGYPDPRYLIDTAGFELVAVLRDEQLAGRLADDTRVLHVARTNHEFQQVPLGVFTGALEWLASEEPDRSFHTGLQRQPHIDELPTLLGPDFAYVVLEPAGLASDPTPSILAAGYELLFENQRGTVYRHRER